jgi:hypothetical protein
MLNKLISSAGWALSGALLGNSWGRRVWLSGLGGERLLLGRSSESLLGRSREGLLLGSSEGLLGSGVNRWGRGGLLGGWCCCCCGVDGDARADLLGSGRSRCASAKERRAAAGHWSGLFSGKGRSLLLQGRAALLGLGDVRRQLAAHHSASWLRSLARRSIT